MTAASSMEDYRVQLEAYAGPLDLLLYLVKRNEIDLHDIPIAELTEQYLQHLQHIPQVEIEQAGEFLVMAATLLEIKSQMIMPRPEQEDEDENEAAEQTPETDPRYELVQQLLAYKRYKSAAFQLERFQEEWARRFPAHPVARPKPKPGEVDDAEAKPIEIDLEDVNVLDLCETFSRILESIGHTGTHHEVTYDDTPISLHAADIYDRLDREGAMSLQKMFEGRRNRSEMIGLFLATLELVRDSKVRVLQDAEAGEIKLEARPEAEWDTGDTDEPADWHDPETGEMQYDWPDEDGKRRFMRRLRMRFKREGKEPPAFAMLNGGIDDDDDEDDDEFLAEDEDQLNETDDLDDEDEDYEEFLVDDDD